MTPKELTRAPEPGAAAAPQVSSSCGLFDPGLIPQEGDCGDVSAARPCSSVMTLLEDGRPLKFGLAYLTIEGDRKIAKESNPGNYRSNERRHAAFERLRSACEQQSGF